MTSKGDFITHQCYQVSSTFVSYSMIKLLNTIDANLHFTFILSTYLLTLSFSFQAIGWKTDQKHHH